MNINVYLRLNYFRVFMWNKHRYATYNILYIKYTVIYLSDSVLNYNSANYIRTSIRYFWVCFNTFQNIYQKQKKTNNYFL